MIKCVRVGAIGSISSILLGKRNSTSIIQMFASGTSMPTLGDSSS